MTVHLPTRPSSRHESYEPPSDVDGPVTPRIYRGKRALDVAVLALLAVPALVLGLLCAAAILCDDGRPVMVRQIRVGLAGRPFAFLKLRTMIRGCPPESEQPQALLITRVGKVLRRLSLDELPQLINVARGEMSFVGPRPNFSHRAKRYDDRQRQRLSALPGLTGLAQVSGRNRLDWDERTELDLLYVAQQSPLLDLAVLTRSVRIVLSGDGIDGHPPP